jgi:hypothetical protein
MQIIFEQNLVEELRQKHIVLELDTIQQDGMTDPITLYALIENLDIFNLSNLADVISQHQTMVTQYKSNQYDDAIFNANALLSEWGGELDEFYRLVITTSEEYRDTNFNWNGIRYTKPVD